MTKKYSKLNWNAFRKYKNIHSNDIAVVCGTGKTLLDYKKIPNAIHIGCNSCAYLETFVFDYYFFNDWLWSSKETKNKVTEYRPNIEKFFGSFVSDAKFGCSLDCAINADAAWYDIQGPFSMHRGGIFETEIDKYWIGDGGGSTIFVCLQFALFCGFRTINIVGCDISGSEHFYPKNRKSDLRYLHKSWHKFKNFVTESYPDVIFNVINPIGLKGLFNDIYQYNS